jgi:hypothetical protein
MNKEILPYIVGWHVESDFRLLRIWLWLAVPVASGVSTTWKSRSFSVAKGEEGARSLMVVLSKTPFVTERSTRPLVDNSIVEHHQTAKKIAFGLIALRKESSLC